MNKIKKWLSIVFATIFMTASAFAFNQHTKTLVKHSVSFEDIGSIKVTGYDTCASCCGKTDGITSSGTHATVGRTCAYNYYPAGTKLYIVGIGYRIVEDTGGMKGIDVLCNNHAECYAITGYYRVYVVHDVYNLDIQEIQ